MRFLIHWRVYVKNIPKKPQFYTKKHWGPTSFDFIIKIFFALMRKSVLKDPRKDVLPLED